VRVHAADEDLPGLNDVVGVIAAVRSGTTTSVSWRASALTSHGWPWVSSKAAAGVRGEALAGVVGVLLVELGDLVRGEVAQGQRLDLDVEGARGAEPAVAAGRDLVVADVAQTDQREGPREAAGRRG
jgi:hypothetical protein